MAHTQSTTEREPTPLPYWSQVLRALRTSRGITQDCWATQLGYSRATIRRWESGRSVPSADAEQALIALCESRHIFRDIPGGPFTGYHISPEWLADTLATARLEEGSQKYTNGSTAGSKSTSYSPDETNATAIEPVLAQVLTTLVKNSADAHGSSQSNTLLGKRFLCREVGTVDHGTMISCECLTHALIYVTEELERNNDMTSGPQFGIHTGEVICLNDTVFGKPVEVCHQLARLAQPGTGLVSGIVADLAADGPFHFTEVPALEAHHYPGIPSMLRLNGVHGRALDLLQSGSRHDTSGIK